MRITKLDGLRGIFSLMVVLFHYRSEYIPEFIHNNFIIRQSGYFVDFFFILSGFVITYNYQSLNKLEDVVLYLKKRLIRIYPLLLFTTLSYYVIEILSNTLLPSYAGGDPYDFKLSFFKTMDTLLLLNSTPVFTSTGLGMNYPSWSISSEIISYFVFGLTSLYSIGKNKKWVVLSIIFICTVFCVYNKHFFFTEDYGFIRGLICFNLGYFVWYFSKKDFAVSDKLEYLIPILILVIFYQLNSYKSVNHQMFGLITIPIFFSLSIVILLKTNGYLSKFLDIKPLNFLGQVSYSVYLNHALLILLIPRISFSILKIPQNSSTEIYVLIASLLFIIFYSAYTYKYIELKGGQFLRKKMLKN